MNPFLSSAIKAAAAGRINNLFEQFLETYINIPLGIRSDASTSQKHIREFLQEESSRVSTFPRILERNDSDFISGSFGRHTKIWPLDDIDILFPLDGYDLWYWRNGVVTPNTVVSDGGIMFNPLLGSRWATGGTISSDLLVSNFCQVLKRGYPRSDVSINGEAVTVQLALGASAESDGVSFDVVPCFRLNPYNGTPSFYLIPDGHNGWKHTNPRLDEAACASLNEFHGRIYRKVVKLVKWWNAYKLNGAFGSYYIELSIANYFAMMRSSGQRITVLSEGVAYAFGALRRARIEGDIPSPVSDAPAVQLGVLTAAQDQKLTDAYANSATAVAHENSGRVEQAISAWKSIFGADFAE
ncbi:MAG TPA: hypothetical protein VF133_10780 [Terriglobales bacterium]